MGCASSKAAQTVENVDSKAADETLGRRHQKDTSMLMCPYFKVAADQRAAFTKSCDALYTSAAESEDVLFYGTASNEEGVHIRQGYRSAEAMVSHLQRTEVHMSETLRTAQLQKVEVHGTRKQITKVKKQTTRIDETSMQFFEMHPKMHSIRRPTAFSGQMGSDKLVSIHVTLQVSTVTELRTMEHKIKCVHRRACGIAGNESFFFSRCMEQGLAKIVATFDTMESGIEHLACMVAHLGMESLRWLELHGPEWELAKIKAMLGRAAAGAEAAAGAATDALKLAAQKVSTASANAARDVLKLAAQKASEDAVRAKACAEAAAIACGQKARDALAAARDKTAAGVQAVQRKAKAMADQVFLDAMKIEGTTEEAAKAMAKTAYKRAMDAINDMRQAAGDAAKSAYDAAVAAGRSAEGAMHEAEAAAQAAARAAQGEMKELTEDSEAALRKAEALGSEGVRVAMEEYLIIRLSAEVGALETERLLGEAAAAVRRALLSFYGAVKQDAIAACDATFKAADAAVTVTEEGLGAARDQAKAAAYAVASAGEEMYLIAYDRALAAGRTAADAKVAAVQAAEYAAGKALDLWKQASDLCASAWKAAQSMVAQGVQALAKVLGAAGTWMLDTARAIRRSLVKGAYKASAVVHDGMLDFAWAVGAVVDAASDALESAAGVIGDAASSAKHHFDHAITMIPHFSFPVEHQEGFKKVCADFQRVSVQSSDTLFYGTCYKEGGACIRHGYRSASAMVSYLRESEAVMTQATKYAKLQKVEVHGTRRQLVKVRKQVTKVSTVSIEFYETDRKVRGIRRATQFSGAAGSDDMVTAHLTVNPTDAQHKTVGQKVKAVHKAAREHPGVHHFSVSRSTKTGAVKIMGTFASMEAGMEHLSVAAAHLGSNILHSLEMHGPGAELDKVKGLLGSAAAAASGAASACMGTVKGALAAAEKKAEDEVLEAKALAEAAEKAVEAATSEAAKDARDKMACTIESLQMEAEEMAQIIYKDTMKAEKGAEEYVRDLAKQSYKAAMDSYSDIRQAADGQARKAYERAIAAGSSAEQALEEAHKAADVAASAMREELADVADAAQADLDSARDGVKKKLEAVAAAAKAAADFAAKSVAAVASPASKEAKGTMLGMHGSLKASSEKVVLMHYEKTVYSAERVAVVGERARAAAWSVAVTHQEAYFLGYERAIIERRGSAEAKAAGHKAAEDSVGKVLAVWKQAETYAAEALQAARAMAAKEEAAIVGLWSSGVSFTLDAETSVRQSLYSGAAMAEEELHEATEDVAWAVAAAVGSASEGVSAAHNQLSARLKSWYDALVTSEASVRAVADESADKAQMQKTTL